MFEGPSPGDPSESSEPDEYVIVIGNKIKSPTGDELYPTNLKTLGVGRGGIRGTGEEYCLFLEKLIKEMTLSDQTLEQKIYWPFEFSIRTSFRKRSETSEG